jgi:stearoyl-CoA desaturase (delta-9 desaturase)
MGGSDKEQCMSFIDFLAHGWTGSPAWMVAVYFIAVTQLTVLSVTLFLHRSAAHRAVDFHPLLAHLFRFWTWLTTAMITREWAAIHRKHHARVETDEDPHSPLAHGIWKVLIHGVVLYQEARRDRAMITQYSAGMHDDWIERHLYAPRNTWGPVLMLVIDFVLFGFVGVAIWAVQMLWIPIMAAGVINGLGHWWGYRNFETDDRSTNLTPWALALGGEELHNNHHAFPSSAKFALRRYEVDIGWVLIRLCERAGLARVLRVAPTLTQRPNITLPDTDTLKAVVVARFDVSTRYFRDVIMPVLREEAAAAGDARARLSRRLRNALANDGRWLSEDMRERLNAWVAHRPELATVCEFRDRLQAVIARTALHSEARLHALQEWCRQAEASGIRALQTFAAELRGLMLAPAHASS